MNKVALGLGSNLGEKEENLEKAIEYIAANPDIEIENVADFIETAPMGVENQPNFLNTAITIHTLLTPEELLETTQEIEQKLGRQSKGDYAPRPIDIDILLYGQEVVCTDSLTIPHPLMHEREFVLTPLSEIASEWMHPILGIPITELASELAGY